jgi:glucuronate isomerase
MIRSPGGSFPKNDTSRITDLYKFFRKYPKCRFELLSAADGNSMDVIQAAIGNKNVYVGGMWWYNFRPSMYKLSMQYRFEALAPEKCVLIASDATCIEWCYAKVLLVKKLLAEFLNEQVRNGWIDREQAIYTAKTWLYDAPAAYYI